MMWHKEMGTDDKREKELKDMDPQMRRAQITKHVKWLELAAEGGQVEAMSILATVIAELGGDVTVARHWLEKGARAGRRDAMAFYGHCLLNGEFGMEPDEAEGIHWMGRAAHAGSLAAKSFLTQNGYASRTPKRGRNKAPRHKRAP